MTSKNSLWNTFHRLFFYENYNYLDRLNGS